MCKLASSKNLQWSRNHGSRVNKVFAVNVLHDTKVLVSVVNVYLAGSITTLVPGKELPDRPNGNLYLPNDISEKRKAVETIHLSGSRVVDYHVEASNITVIKGVGCQFLAGGSCHHATTKCWKELEPSQDGNDSQTEEGGIKGAIHILRLTVNMLSDPTDLRGSPGTCLQQQILEFECHTGLWDKIVSM